MKSTNISRTRVFPYVLAVAVALMAGSASAQQVKINEIRTDHTGADTDEYFELIGTPSMSLTGLTYLVVGDSGTVNTCGVIESVTDLSTFSLQADGLLCLRNSAATPVLTGYDGAVALVFENSDNVTHMLVSGFTGMSGQDLDTNDDGVFDVTPWTGIVDCVGLSEGTVPNCAGEERLYCATVVGPDGSFVPGHVYRCSDTQAWLVGQFSPLGATDTPGGANPSCGAPPPDFTDALRSPCVPLVGQSVAVTARVRFASGANLHYRVNDGGETIAAMSLASMSGDTSTFTANIPGQLGNADLVEYFVRAYNVNPDTTQDFDQGYFIGTVSIGSLRVNDANGANIYRFYGARIRGNVTVPIGVFSNVDTDYYVQDATGGINVFQFGPHPEQTLLGDDVTVEGALEQFNGKLEISNAGPCATLNVTVHGAGSPPDPLPILTCGLDESVEGKLVRIYGVHLISGGDLQFVANKNYGVYNTRTCNQDTVVMRIDGDTAIPGQTIATEFINVVGIAGQFDTFSPFTEGYQIQPRYPSDINFQDPATGVGDPEGGVVAQLLPNVPNPFGRSTLIRYRIDGTAAGGARVPVQLAVYDLRGRLVAELVRAEQAPGEYAVLLSAAALARSTDGIYFYRLRVAGRTLTRKLALIH